MQMNLNITNFLTDNDSIDNNSNNEDEDSNKIKVVSTLGGSPAEEAGITSGSLIEKVDGISS